MKKHLNTLYVTREDSWLSLDGETVTVSQHGQKLLRVPLHNLEAIQTFGWNIGATPQLMAYCAKVGVHLAFCSPHGRLFCHVSGFTHGNVLLRRQQYRLADQPESRLAVARNFVVAKILNARQVLQRNIRERSGEHPLAEQAVRELAAAARNAREASSEAELLGVEGNAAESYFGVFETLITAEGFPFTCRNRRPPRDPVNALLSFAYAVLASDCKSALEAVGLDSAVGFYHKDRPGRPGLALDLMEEFRAPLADRFVLALINRKQIKPNDFMVDEGGGVQLSDDAKRTMLTAWQERKQDGILHPWIRERMTVGMLPHIQARLLAQYVRGALDAYPPMFWK